ncbi:hypothetical protein [Nitrosomonas marina]|uniref:Uncharacterized protein n=1 Tax=Nitrosomonas marina TaxID=917 RepID=A0A1H8C5W1_9PROT|nr:hypothetical protein [Nitrosomonas marina]SEM90581.1 hypothetical protein SAMN05216325_10433 [Nitrosomonas marina]
MNAYQLLFNVSVEHMYFTDHVCKSLNFVPTVKTVHLLNRPGFLLKTVANRLSVFFETDKIDRLHLYAEDELSFTFKVFSRDPSFFWYTAPARPSSNALLFFDNQQSAIKTDGKQLLHRERFVSERDYQDSGSDRIRQCLESRDYHVPPCFIVQFTMLTESLLLTPGQGSEAVRNFVISFTSSKTLWKYYLMGDLSRRSLYIRDLDSKLMFEEIGKIILPGNHPARMLQSTRAIQMHELPQQRLQLRESQNRGDKILINRLPNASVNHLHGDTVNGKMHHISEIYVH